MWLQNNYTVSFCGFIGVCIGYFTGHQEICIMIGVGIGILIRIVQSKSKWNASGLNKEVQNEKDITNSTIIDLAWVWYI